jgi:membrane-associated phospholipid phosphatase
MDATITRWINAAAGSSAILDSVMVALTRFGVPALVLLVVLQWWVKNDRLHVRHAALSAGLSFLLGLLLNQVILLFVHRVRPYDAGVTHLLIPPSADWSFPSDHATASMAIVAAFALQRLPRRALALSIVALAICWSRVFVGTHYVTDVLGGVLTGIAGALAVRLTYREGSRLDRLATRLL